MCFESFVFNGHSMVNSTFNVGDGATKNILCRSPNKILGLSAGLLSKSYQELCREAPIREFLSKVVETQ